MTTGAKYGLHYLVVNFEQLARSLYRLYYNSAFANSSLNCHDTKPCANTCIYGLNAITFQPTYIVCGQG